MDKVIDIIKDLTCGKHIKKAQKALISGICDKLNDAKYNQLTIELNKIKSSVKYTNALNKTIMELYNSLTKDELTTEQKILYEDIVKIIEDEHLEETLDGQCKRYTKFTKSNPAEYLKYDAYSDRYELFFNDKSKKHTSKQLQKLVSIAKIKSGFFSEKIGKKPTLKSDIEIFKKIEYKTKKIIIYKHNNVSFYDINHVINLLNNTNPSDKYYEYNKFIELRDFRDNEYGGFYVKEFINQKTFFKILLESHDVFSNKFRDDVTTILDELAKTDSVTIKNDTFILTKAKPPIDHFIVPIEYYQTYENEYLVNLIKREIDICKKIEWSIYSKKHLMYCFITTLPDPLNLNRILCKIGYTYDIVTRFKSLKIEYGCNFYLLCVKTVNAEQDEKDFHTQLKLKYKHLHVPLTMGKHEKTEIYVFDHDLYQLFKSYINKTEINDTVLDDTSKNILHEYFNNISERFENDLMLKLKHTINLKDVLTEFQKETAINMHNKHYEYLMLKENNRHDETMMDKKIREKELDFEIQKFNFSTKQNTSI